MIALLPLDRQDWERLAEDPAAFAGEHTLTLGPQADLLRAVAEQTLTLFQRTGVTTSPWSGYLAVDQARHVVGTCGFKAPPDDEGVVEVAYFTFPGFEGQGYATAMAAGLVERARAAGGVRRLRAHTLPERNASTRILEKAGFGRLGEGVDPEDGPVWRWETTLTTEIISIRLAEERDVERAMVLVRDCIDGMRQAGIDQWDEWYPAQATLLSDARDRTLYLASLETEPMIGILVLNEYQNPQYAAVPWTTTGVRVAVVHRLMVDPRCQGRGIARQLMRYAEERAQELGYDALRLDAFTANPRALRLYHGLGYHDAGWVTFRKGVFRRFEKRLG
jgi:[ribosomal protein S5]-alanine N-acetyltransferase